MATSPHRFAPSQSSPARFVLWAILSTAAVVALFLAPSNFGGWLMLSSLGSVAGAKPAPPDRALKPGFFITVVVAGALLAAGIYLIVALAQPPGTATVGVPMWLRVVVAVVWIVTFVRELVRFRALRLQAAAA